MAFTESGIWMGGSGGFDGGGMARHSRQRREVHWAEVNSVLPFIRRTPWLQRFLGMSVLLMLVLKWISSPGTPVEVLSAEISPDVVRVGQPMQVTYIVNRTQICPNTIRSWWTTETNQELPAAKLPPRSRVEPRIGRNLAVYLELNAPHITGRMCYQSSVLHRCVDGSYTVDTPPLCVTVTP